MNQRDIFKNKRTFFSVLIWGMVTGYTVLYISLIFNDNIWTDEAFTWQLIHNGGIRKIIEGTAADVHPPLYYLWAKLFITLFGDNLQVLKIASIVPMSGLLVYAATTIRRWFGDLVAFLFILFLANIPCTMEFAVQPRMYSAALLCVTVCGVSAYLAFTQNRKRDWFWYAVTALAAAYLHYFAFVSVGIIGLMLLIFVVRKAIKQSPGHWREVPEEASERETSRQANSGSSRDEDIRTNFAHTAREQGGQRQYGESPNTTDPRRVDKNDSGTAPHSGNKNRTRQYMSRKNGRQQLYAWLLTFLLMLAGYAPWLPELYKQVTTVEAGYWIPALTYDTVIDCFHWAFGLNTTWGSLTTYLVMTILTSGGAILLYNHRKWQVPERFALLCMLVPALTFAFGVIVSILPGRSAVYRDQYILPALGLLALFFAIALADWSRPALIVVTAFMLLLGAAQYRECFRQEYHSSFVPQTEAFFETYADPEDPVIYDWEVYGLIYAYYWPADRLYYYQDFDWSSSFDQAWLLATYNEWLPTADFLNSYGLGIEDMGAYGVEQNNFEIFRIFPLQN